MLFLVLRDFYGVTQVVLETEEMVSKVKALNKESTLSVTGVVRSAAAKTPNWIPETLRWYPQRSQCWAAAVIMNSL